MSKNDYRITIRLSKVEWLQLNLYKEESGLTASEYIRHLLFSSPVISSRLNFEKRILWLATRLYLGSREAWQKEFEDELMDRINEEADNLLKKWGY